MINFPVYILETICTVEVDRNEKVIKEKVHEISKEGIAAYYAALGSLQRSFKIVSCYQNCYLQLYIYNFLFLFFFGILDI